VSVRGGGIPKYTMTLPPSLSIGKWEQKIFKCPMKYSSDYSTFPVSALEEPIGMCMVFE